jgi:Immunoglobulin V-set domain
MLLRMRDLQVTWKRFDDIHPLTIGMYPFAPDPRISVDLNQRLNEWSLIIQDIRPTDEGVYQCQISTKDDLDSYDITLNVKSE